MFKFNQALVVLALSGALLGSGSFGTCADKLAAAGLLAEVRAKSLAINESSDDLSRSEALAEIKTLAAPPGWKRIVNPSDHPKALGYLHDKLGEAKFGKHSVIVAFENSGVMEVAEGYLNLVSNFNPRLLDFNHFYELRMHERQGNRKSRFFTSVMVAPNYERVSFSLAPGRVTALWVQMEGEFGLKEPPPLVIPYNLLARDKFYTKLKKTYRLEIINALEDARRQYLRGEVEGLKTIDGVSTWLPSIEPLLAKTIDYPTLRELLINEDLAEMPVFNLITAAQISYGHNLAKAGLGVREQTSRYREALLYNPYFARAAETHSDLLDLMAEAFATTDKVDLDGRRQATIFETMAMIKNLITGQ